MKTHESFTHPVRGSRFRFAVAILTGVNVLFTGCVSMRSVPLPVSGQPTQTVAVKVGDKVQVQTRSGETFSFTVTAVESEALAGKSEPAGNEVRVKYQDIAGLQVKEVDVARTAAGVGVGVVVAIAAVALVIALRSMAL
jgi:hypothetical protein